MTKKILAIIGIGIIAATMLAGCSQKNVEADATLSTESTSQTTTTTTTTKPAESTTKPTETTTKRSEPTTPTKAPVNKTTTRSTTVATTEKPTTTEPTTEPETEPPTQAPTVKNVSASEVQAQVNSYIRSKGVTVDGSLNSGNSGWSGTVTTVQKYLNDGTSLSQCKAFVNEYIREMGSDITMNCYYDGSNLYVCYL